MSPLYALYLLLVGGALLTPVYYRARAKGYRGGVWVAAAGVLGVGSGLVGLGVLSLGFPVGFLLATFIVPAKAGAPGKAYLTIHFACPECGKDVSFPRRCEGDAEECPECGEVIRVPRDEHSPKLLPRDGGTEEEGAEERVCFRTFGRADEAHLLAAVLSENGVPSGAVSDEDGRPVSYITSVLGYRVMIDAAQWDEATKIAGRCRQDESMP